METKINRANRRKLRIRAKIGKENLRLSVFRSNKFLSAQIIDDQKGKTLLGLMNKKAAKTKTDSAKEFGVQFAQKALELGIKKVVFDRGSYLYIGRVRAFAEGAREGGLQF